MLVVAAALALIWANSPAADGYAQFWHQKISIAVGTVTISEDLQHWVNDGLMVIFFFVIGLEIKRELVVGDLRDRRAAALPALAALGGVAIPALIYLAVLGGGGDAASGWGIPMATDIAFAVGVLALLGARVSAGAKLFLLSVAIVDDIVAILVIAVFYSTGINLWWLAIAAVGLLAAVVLCRVGVVSPWGYVPLGVLTWVATFESGVHATLVGVAFGLLTPAHPVRGRAVLRALEEALHPVSAFLVIPLFALANAGVDLRGGKLGESFTHQLTWAVIVGLILGKIIGIAGVTHLVRWRRWGALPADMHPREIIGVAALGGIGFTVSLFITDLAFESADLISQAKVGILTASAAAALIGTALLLRTPAGPRQGSPEANRDRVEHRGAQPSPSVHDFAPEP